MPVVRLKLKVPGPDGDVVVPGELEFEPSTRLAVDDYVLLPERFRQRVETGDETVTLAETGVDWCWHIVERFDGGTERWVQVGPDPVDYRDLVDVDPATLEPVAEPEAAWWATVGQLDTDLSQQVVAGAVVDGDLVLQHRDGSTTVAGPVVGGQGPPGAEEIGYAESAVPFVSSAVVSEAAGAMPGLIVTVEGQGRPVEIEAFFPGVFSPSNLYADVVPFVSLADDSVVATYASSISQSTGFPVTLKRRMILADGVSYTFKAGIFSLANGVTSAVFAGEKQRAYLSVMTR